MEPMPRFESCEALNNETLSTIGPRTMGECSKCGFNPALAQMRPTLDGEMPMASAFRARLPWVALGGVSCTVLVMTFGLVSVASGGTREGLDLSRLRPSTPSSRYRRCQRQTVGFGVRAA